MVRNLPVSTVRKAADIAGYKNFTYSKKTPLTVDMTNETAILVIRKITCLEQLFPVNSDMQVHHLVRMPT